MMDWTLYPFEQDDTPCLTALEGIKIITGVHPANKISGGVHPVTIEKRNLAKMHPKSQMHWWGDPINRQEKILGLLYGTL